MPFVEIESGYKIHYIEKGQGKNLIYIHGFLGNALIYKDQVEHFSKNYRVITIDHLGYGESDKPKNESYDLINLARYVDQILSKIIGDEKIILHGHSMGGMIALSYATDPELAKRLEALVLMGTAPKMDHPGMRNFLESFDFSKMKFISRPIIEKFHMRACFGHKFIRENPDMIEEFIIKTLEVEEFVAHKSMNAVLNNYNVEDKLHAISVPTLILSGDTDQYVLPKESVLLNEKISNSKLVSFSPKIGHMINYEAQEEYHKVLEEFLIGI